MTTVLMKMMTSTCCILSNIYFLNSLFVLCCIYIIVGNAKFRPNTSLRVFAGKVIVSIRINSQYIEYCLTACLQYDLESVNNSSHPSILYRYISRPPIRILWISCPNPSPYHISRLLIRILQISCQDPWSSFFRPANPWSSVHSVLP